MATTTRPYFLMVSVGRWIMELVGFPVEGSQCLLLTGGSVATLNALSAARHRAAARAGWDMRAEGLQSGRQRLVLYASTESHSSIQKCVEQLGIGTSDLRVDRGGCRISHAARCAAPCDRGRPEGGTSAFRDRRLRRRHQHRRNRSAGRDRKRSRRIRHLAARRRRIRRMGGARSRLRRPFQSARASGFRHAQSAQVVAGSRRLRRIADAASRRCIAPRFR